MTQQEGPGFDSQFDRCPKSCILKLIGSSELLIGVRTCFLPFAVVSRPPDEHSGGGGGSDGAPGRGGGRGGESASQGEGRVPLLLRQPQEQHRVQPHAGGAAEDPG